MIESLKRCVSHCLANLVNIFQLSNPSRYASGSEEFIHWVISRIKHNSSPRIEKYWLWETLEQIFHVLDKTLPQVDTIPESVLPRLLSTLDPPDSDLSPKVLYVMLELGKWKPEMVKPSFTGIIWGIMAWITNAATTKATVTAIISTFYSY